MLVLLGLFDFYSGLRGKALGHFEKQIYSCIQIFDKIMFQIWFPVCWGILSLVPPNEGPWQAGSRERI